MDTVWVAYIRDRQGSLYQLDSKKYSMFEGEIDSETIIGVFDSKEKAERALDIVLRRIGWCGVGYHPNVWVIPDRYEYGWREVPFNQFDSSALYSVCKFISRR